MACGILLAILAAGWAWALQGDLLSNLGTLGQWALLTLPGLAGCGIIIGGEPQA